ncbi:coronin-2A-like isoform X4 [Phycodurus eques]|uniref:coronin-2A-like isoform X4 n=1 Tax=Phycodurus eques TaxID=693459 RepID=UPI002ACEC935|nr:coronin-2A-like isoform X4 [Phycodurus eques]
MRLSTVSGKQYFLLETVLRLLRSPAFIRGLFQLSSRCCQGSTLHDCVRAPVSNQLYHHRYINPPVPGHPRRSIAVTFGGTTAHLPPMSWRSSFHCSKFRHIFGKASSREHGFDGVPITRGVHDNQYCSVNPCFIAMVTECAGGGSFLVLPIHHTGRVDPQHPRVCGHRAQVVDIKWNPFDDSCIASCSEDCTVFADHFLSSILVLLALMAERVTVQVKIWDIPSCGVERNLTQARKTLIGHSRRVGLIEWHPTAENLLLSSAYDYKVLLWDVSQDGAVLRCPVRVVMAPVHHRFPSEMLLLSVSFNLEGNRLAVASKDRRVRVLDPRTGRILQVSCNKYHRANKVVYIRGLKMLLSTGCSPWNHRQIVLWDPDDLSEPLYEEDLDGSAGVLFPFFDPDTDMLYLAGKGDGNIRYYELSSEKPYISFLTEFRSPLPHKGLAVMPKRGLDVNICEIFRFYRLIAVKGLVEPLSMIVPRKKVDLTHELSCKCRKHQMFCLLRQSATFHEDLYPMTAGNRAAMTAQEWLTGINRAGPVLMSLHPGIRAVNPYPESLAGRSWYTKRPTTEALPRSTPGLMEKNFLQEQLAYQDAKYHRDTDMLSGWQSDESQLWTYDITPHCCEPAERPPPTTQDELREAFYKQQEEIRGLREILDQKDVSTRGPWRPSW